MQRVFCHSLGVTSEGKHSFEGLPPERFEIYAKRSFVLAEKGDLVVVPPHPETEDPRQEIAVLNESGLGPDIRNLVYGLVLPDRGLFLPDGSWGSSGRNSEGRIFPFSGKATLPFLLARRLGMAVDSPGEEKTKRLDGKDFFQSLGEECIPEGEVLGGEREVLEFFARLNGGKWIVKTSHNASGMSTCLLTPDNPDKETVLTFVAEGKLPVAQKYHRHHFSPSVNMEVAPNGEITDMFISGQILSVSEEGGAIHEGNIYPCELPAAIKHYLLKNSARIGRRYSEAGYFGPLGVDWIVDTSSNIPPKAVEVNARVTGPRYPFRVMKKLQANSFCLKNVEFPPGSSPFDLRQRLDPVWFHPGRKSGIIFFNFNQSMGKAALISLGRDLRESDELLREAENSLF